MKTFLIVEVQKTFQGKRLRIEVQPAQTNGAERVKRFVIIHLHCIVSNLNRISEISTLPPWMRWFPSNSWVLFGSFLLSHSKTINAKVVSFLKIYAKCSNQKVIQFRRVMNSLKTWKTSKGVFWYKREAPKSARLRAFARFTQWLIRPCLNPKKFALPCKRTVDNVKAGFRLYFSGDKLLIMNLSFNATREKWIRTLLSSKL